MQILDHDKAPLMKRRHFKNTRKKSNFTLECEAAGCHPSTIRKRMRKNPELTLEQALAQPKQDRSSSGRRGANKAWRKERLEL